LIRNVKENEDGKEHTINLMKTITIPKADNHSPYFVFPTRKFNIKSPQKIAPTKSLIRLPDTLMTEKDDVSIEISGDEEVTEPQPLPTSNLEFGCSEIKEAKIANDSSFLEASQKAIFGELEEMCKK
jgi:virulence-associated protein VagC